MFTVTKEKMVRNFTSCKVTFRSSHKLILSNTLPTQSLRWARNINLITLSLARSFRLTSICTRTWPFHLKKKKKKQEKRLDVLLRFLKNCIRESFNKKSLLLFSLFFKRNDNLSRAIKTMHLVCVK